MVEKEKRRYPFEEYILLLKSNFLGIFNNLSSKKRNQRDKGMLEVYLEKKPDLIIVGDYHARYLKKNNIDLNYILFRGNSWRENLISYFYQNSKYKPEKTIIIST